MSGLPGLRGGEHVGLTVPDLEEAERFLCDVLGAVMVFDGGTIDDREIVVDVLGAGPGDSCRYRFYRLGTGLNLEVFEYSTDASGAPPANHVPGGHHIALYVDDIEAAIRHLDAHGVKIDGKPQYIEDGPAAGGAWLYFKAPWGLQLELVSFPKGKAYEADAPVKLWSPLRPSQ
ncbi:MAG: VOC family protein [Rhizobiaceae bacterium]